MKDYYVEWMVAKKRSLTDSIVRVISVIVLVISVLLFSLTANIIVFLVALAAAGFAYFAFIFTNVEYEYIFVTGEFSIDRILSKTRRKRMERFDINKIEIVAPLKSPKLDGFAHRKDKEYDYSSGVRNQQSHIYVMYCDGKKVIFEPNRKLIEALRDCLPHKVHMEL